MNTESNFKFLLIVTLLLSLGLGAVGGYFAPHPQRHFGPGAGGPGEKGMKKMMLHKLDKALALTEDQEQKVREIFAANEPKMRALHEEIRPKFNAIRDAARDEIRKILTPEQITKFEALNERMDERMKRFEAKTGR